MRTQVEKKLETLRWNRQLASNEYTQRRLPFGKYIGTQIKDLPLDYIKWAIIHFQNKEWAEMFARELQRRDPKYR